MKTGLLVFAYQFLIYGEIWTYILRQLFLFDNFLKVTLQKVLCFWYTCILSEPTSDPRDAVADKWQWW